MSFKQVDIKKILEKINENPEFKETWERSRNEYELIHDVTRIRKELSLTQK